ncbi:TonB C-terminal domain-containing protein [bacterium]|nr:TonB C-terminal domain-containing protein [bacterium]
MNRFLMISAAAHVVLLLLLPFVPGLFEDEEMGLTVYAVELVDIQSRPVRVETPRAPEPEETVEIPPEQVEEVVEEQIPEEPTPVRRRVAAQPQPEARESLADRLAERLRSQDEERSEVEPVREQVEPVASASATVTAARFPYAWYLSIIQGKVGQNWKQPSSRLITQDKLSTRVSFRIRRDGAIELVTVRRPSGLSNVDQSAVKAVRSSAPFPPLPDDYLEDHLDVTIDFTVTQE